MGIKKIIERFKHNWFVRLFIRIEKHEALGYSAHLAYFFLLSLFPLLITIFSLLPYLPIEQHHIMYFLEDFAPGETLDFIRGNLEEIFESQSGSLLSFGIIATLWAASNGMNAVIRAVNRAYEIEENRPFFIVRGMSVILTIVMIFVFLVALLIPIFGRSIGEYLFSKLGKTNEFINMWTTLRWLISSVILFIVFSVVYTITPNRKIRCVTVLPGALFSTIGWIVASFGFSFYVNNFGNYTLMYGSLGVIIVLMIWFYLSGAILIIGGEINGLNDEIKGGKKCK